MVIVWLSAEWLCSACGKLCHVLVVRASDSAFLAMYSNGLSLAYLPIAFLGSVTRPAWHLLVLLQPQLPINITNENPQTFYT